MMQDAIHCNNIMQQEVPHWRIIQGRNIAIPKRRQTCALGAEDEKKHLLYAILLS